MAAGFFNLLADGNRVYAVSAGTDPAERIHPEVVTVMQEMGIDLSAVRPRKLTAELAKGADLLVTMGCGDQCPVVPGQVPLDWELPDPKGLSLDDVRAIRDDVRARVVALINERGWRRA